VRPNVTRKADSVEGGVDLTFYDRSASSHHRAVNFPMPMRLGLRAGLAAGNTVVLSRDADAPYGDADSPNSPRSRSARGVFQVSPGEAAASWAALRHARSRAQGLLHRFE